MVPIITGIDVPVETINILEEDSKIPTDDKVNNWPGVISTPLLTPVVVTSESPTNIEIILDAGFCMTKSNALVSVAVTVCAVSATARVVTEVLRPKFNA